MSGDCRDSELLFISIPTAAWRQKPHLRETRVKPGDAEAHQTTQRPVRSRRRFECPHTESAYEKKTEGAYELVDAYKHSGGETADNC